MSTLNIGAHVSLGRSVHLAVKEAREAGLDSMQIFASSPGAWKPPILNAEALADFCAARLEYNINPLFIHAIYLINLASEDPNLARRSSSSLRATLQAASAMGAAGVVTHIGSHAGRGFEAVAPQIAGGLRTILEAAPPDVDLVLENSAGAGSLVGADLAELGDLIGRAGGHPRLKVALDTAHLTGAGWNLQDEVEVERLATTIEEHLGERVVLIHANDSAQPPGSRKDRHTNIGEGHVGLEGFRNLLRRPGLRAVPWIMETPNLEQRAADAARLRALAVDQLPTGAAHAS